MIEYSKHNGNLTDITQKKIHYSSSYSSLYNEIVSSNNLTEQDLYIINDAQVKGMYSLNDIRYTTNLDRFLLKNVTKNVDYKYAYAQVNIPNYLYDKDINHITLATDNRIGRDTFATLNNDGSVENGVIRLYSADGGNTGVNYNIYDYPSITFPVGVGTFQPITGSYDLYLTYYNNTYYEKVIYTNGNIYYFPIRRDLDVYSLLNGIGTQITDQDIIDELEANGFTLYTLYKADVIVKYSDITNNTTYNEMYWMNNLEDEIRQVTEPYFRFLLNYEYSLNNRKWFKYYYETQPTLSGNSNDYQVGDIIFSTTPITDSKCLYCDGSTFSQTDYPDLYLLLGSTTLPDLRGRSIRGVNTETVGTLQNSNVGAHTHEVSATSHSHSNSVSHNHGRVLNTSRSTGKPPYGGTYSYYALGNDSSASGASSGTPTASTTITSYNSSLTSKTSSGNSGAVNGTNTYTDDSHTNTAYVYYYIRGAI